MEEGLSYSEQRQSKYNAAIKEVYDLQDLFKEAYQKILSGKLKQANARLDVIWWQLSNDADEKAYIKIKVLNKLITKNQRNRSLFYIYLEKKFMFLKSLQNSQGKGIAYQDNIEDYMD